jgi:hypothetical protein
MKLNSLDDFTRGWIVGDFEPSIVRSAAIEVGVKTYEAGDREERHEHRIVREWTFVLSGSVQMNETRVSKGEFVEIQPGESADFIALEDSTTLVLKTPSIPQDKYFV